jgi:hypothetical protein
MSHNFHMTLATTKHYNNYPPFIYPINTNKPPSYPKDRKRHGKKRHVSFRPTRREKLNFLLPSNQQARNNKQTKQAQKQLKGKGTGNRKENHNPSTPTMAQPRTARDQDTTESICRYQRTIGKHSQSIVKRETN